MANFLTEHEPGISADTDQSVVTSFRGRPKGALVDEVIETLGEYFPASGET